jgi:hypothetical protein
VHEGFPPLSNIAKPTTLNKGQPSVAQLVQEIEQQTHPCAIVAIDGGK